MREYTEKEYWEGLVPDELFEEYLNKYGYEYTPVNRNESIREKKIIILRLQQLDPNHYWSFCPKYKSLLLLLLEKYM